jgi:hypothetical protein
MKWLLLVCVPLLLFTRPAAAGAALGNSALALSALVAENSPVLTASDKHVLAALFEEHLDVPVPGDGKISVRADSITCSAGDVDISAHACNLVFGKETSTLKGRKAHELFATIIELGVRPEGAMGRVYDSIAHLNCTIDAKEIEQRDGGGASCSFDADSGTAQ